MKKYILNGKEPVVTEDIYLWCACFELNRSIAYTDFYYYRVSTIFLGLDHNHYGGKPVLFETMIFREYYNDIYQNRYHTWEESVTGHIEAVEKMIPLWRKNMKMDFVWELFKVTFTAIFLAVFALFLCVIL